MSLFTDLEITRQLARNLERMERELAGDPTADQRSWRAQFADLWQITVTAADTCPGKADTCPRTG